MLLVVRCFSLIVLCCTGVGGPPMQSGSHLYIGVDGIACSRWAHLQGGMLHQLVAATGRPRAAGGRSHCSTADGPRASLAPVAAWQRLRGSLRKARVHPSSGSCLAAPSPPFTKWPHLPGADAEPARRVEVANEHTIPHEGGSSVAGAKGRGRTEPQTNRRECAGWREYTYRGRYGRPGHRCKWAVSLRTVAKRTCCTVLEG